MSKRRPQQVAHSTDAAQRLRKALAKRTKDEWTPLAFSGPICRISGGAAPASPRQCGGESPGCRCFLGRFLSWLSGGGGPEHPDSGFKDPRSAAQRLGDPVQQAKEDMLPRVPGQQAVHDLPPGAKDLRGHADQRPAIARSK